MAEVSSETLAPRIVLITEPERKIRNVGMLCPLVSGEVVGWARNDLRCNAILLGDCLLVVYIDFRECNSTWLGVFRRERFVGRSDGFARSAPVSVKICDDDRRRAQQLAELCRGANVDCGRHRGL
jgi:hypothetical protein